MWPVWDVSLDVGVSIDGSLGVGAVDYSMCSGFWDGLMDGVAHTARVDNEVGRRLEGGWSEVVMPEDFESGR